MRRSSLAVVTPPAGESIVPFLNAVSAPIAGDTPTAFEIDARIEIARKFDPARPLFHRMARCSAVEWLRKFKVDLNALGLPIDFEEDDQPVSMPKLLHAATAGDPPSPATATEPVAPRRLQNGPAEAGLLAALMAGAIKVTDVLAVLRGPEDFGYAALRAVARAVFDLGADGGLCDEAAVIHALKGSATLDLAGGPERISAIAAKEVDRERALGYARIVRELSEERETEVAINKVSTLLGKKGDGRIDSIDEASKLLQSIGTRANAEPDILGGRRWPAFPAPPFWTGPLGDLVALLDPHTEADPIAVYAQLLVCFGSIVGRNAHWVHGASVHHTNLYVAVVGRSGDGKKGTSLDAVRYLAPKIDPDWWRLIRRYRGISSGEGMVDMMADPYVHPKTKVLTGVEDKRALWIETEMGGTLACMSREGAILDSVLCDLWDGVDLANSTKANPTTLTSPHCSYITHTTFGVLKRRFHDGHKESGLGNRILWICSRMSKPLPHGGDFRQVDIRKPLKAVQDAVEFARRKEFATTPFHFDDEAYNLYADLYVKELTRMRPDGLAKFSQRCAPQVRRLALLYALLARSRQIQVPHLLGALEFWRYAERSAAYIFGTGEGEAIDSHKLDAVVTSLRNSEAKNLSGLTAYEINRDAFGGRERVLTRTLIQTLLDRGVIEDFQDASGPRTVQRFRRTISQNSARLRAEDRCSSQPKRRK